MNAVSEYVFLINETDPMHSKVAGIVSARDLRLMIARSGQQPALDMEKMQGYSVDAVADCPRIASFDEAALIAIEMEAFVADCLWHHRVWGYPTQPDWKQYDPEAQTAWRVACRDWYEKVGEGCVAAGKMRRSTWSMIVEAMYRPGLW